MNPNDHKPETQAVMNVTAGDQATVGTPKNWLAQKFAKLWYNDACSQAQDLSTDARRREIIFAVACAECFLVEWLCELTGPGCANLTLEASGKQGILDQWKELPKTLKATGKIPDTPDLAGATWASFQRIVQFRNGLLHGRASRAYVPGHPSPQSMPKVEELQKLRPGDARDAVRQLISELIEAAGTSVPSWLTEPHK